MMKHVVRVDGPAVRGTRISAAILRDLIGNLVDSTQQALRLRIEGRSRAHGRAPAWLERAASFDLVAIEEGSTLLILEAPSVAEAAPERFAQMQLFSPFDPSRSCLDLMNESLRDVLSEKRDSELYDDGLVSTFGGFQRLLGQGVSRIELADGQSLTIDASAVDTLERVRAAIPRDQHVIVAGKLDEIRHSDRFFTVVLEEGDRVRGIATEEVQSESLGSLWGKSVRVHGVAKFRPSRALLRIDADLIELAEGDVSLWSKAPRPTLTPGEFRVPSRTQGPRSGIAAIFGKWPGDETEEELIEALERLS